MTQPPTAPNEVENPIINSPFAGAAFHWQIEKGKRPVKAPGRRPVSYFCRVHEGGARRRKGKTSSCFWVTPPSGSKRTCIGSTGFAAGSGSGARPAGRG